MVGTPGVERLPERLLLWTAPAAVVLWTQTGASTGRAREAVAATTTTTAMTGK